ncbi:MAG TPA: outer membrane lipoprotein carrier protein LolA [Geobacteraceae bacterium]
MKRCTRIALFMLVTLFAALLPAVAATGADLKTVISTLEQGYTLLSDLQADFSQRTTIASIKREERGSGELFIRKPGTGSAMFRFNYVKPRQQIISNGKKVWYYLPENRQVMVTDTATMFSGGNSVALNYLTGMGHVSRDFTISFAGNGRDRKGNYVLELVPKKPNRLMARLQLTISAAAVDAFRDTGKAHEPFPIISSLLVDTAGNRTAIDFSNVKTNRGMGTERFTFKTPAGVEVIKQ